MIELDSRFPSAKSWNDSSMLFFSPRLARPAGTERETASERRNDKAVSIIIPLLLEDAQKKI